MANGLIKFTARSIVTVSETFLSVIFVCTVSTKLLVPFSNSVYYGKEPVKSNMI